jgi:hypothetical protein
MRCASSRLSRRTSHPAARRFSATVNDGKVPAPPGTCATPSAAISFGGAWVMSRPSRMTAPKSASVTPEIARSRVDLPAPLVPSSASTSPSATSRSMSNRTCTGP